MHDPAAELELDRICSLLVELAYEAGDLISSAQPAALSFTLKKNAADIVTAVDANVENLIRARLLSELPSFKFIGEESAGPDAILTDQPTFIVDPIDGTSNFVHGFPEVCVSIGLVVNKIPTVGVVYNPYHNELWSAIRGKGAFRKQGNAEQQRLPLKSTPLQGLAPACIGIEWGSDREGPNFELNLKVFTTLARTKVTGGKFVNSLRCIGSAAIAICRIAAGQLDAFWECGSHSWDVAAAWCILEEAGGMMADGHPGSWTPPVNNRRYLAVRPGTNIKDQREFVEEFWSVIGDDRTMYGPNH